MSDGVLVQSEEGVMTLRAVERHGVVFIEAIAPPVRCGACGASHPICDAGKSCPHCDGDRFDDWQPIATFPSDHPVSRLLRAASRCGGGNETGEKSGR